MSNHLILLGQIFVEPGFFCAYLWNVISWISRFSVTTRKLPLSNLFISWERSTTKIEPPRIVMILQYVLIHVFINAGIYFFNNCF